MDGKFVNELHVQPRLRFDMRNKGVNASRPAFGVPARYLRIGESLVRQPNLSSISLFQEHNRNEGFTDVRLRWFPRPCIDELFRLANLLEVTEADIGLLGLGIKHAKAIFSANS